MTAAHAIRGMLAGPLVLASAPAQAAGVEYPVALAMAAAAWMLVLFGIPAVGFGYMLGQFVGLRTTLLVTAALAMVPLLVLWAARSTPGWIEGAAVMAIWLLPACLLVWFGWRLAAKETGAPARSRNTLVITDLPNG